MMRKKPIVISRNSSTKRYDISSNDSCQKPDLAINSKQATTQQKQITIKTLALKNNNKSPVLISALQKHNFIEHRSSNPTNRAENMKITDAMPEAKKVKFRRQGTSYYNEDLLDATIVTRTNQSTRSLGLQDDALNTSCEMQPMPPTLTAEGHAIIPKPALEMSPASRKNLKKDSDVVKSNARCSRAKKIEQR